MSKFYISVEGIYQFYIGNDHDTCDINEARLFDTKEDAEKWVQGNESVYSYNLEFYVCEKKGE